MLCDGEADNHHRKCPGKFLEKLKSKVIKKLQKNVPQKRSRILRRDARLRNSMKIQKSYLDITMKSLDAVPPKKRNSMIVQYQISELEPKFEVW